MTVSMRKAGLKSCRCLIRRAAVTGAFAVLFIIAFTSAAGAQSFISPFIGYNFGGDAGCPEASNCEDKTRNFGVAFGSLGKVIGAELEFSFIDSFFGDTPGTSSHVLTLMGNAMFAPKFGLVQPYVLAGLGLLKSHAEITTAGLLETDNNHFGWDIGGGIMGFLGPHFGVRGDLRYFHAFQDLEIVGIPIADTKLDFGRLSGGVVFKF
jgi:opacity protein-like surface antigen